MTNVRYIRGDVRAALATLAPGSIDLMLTSSPFLSLRDYLDPADPEKPHEIGHGTPGEFVDDLLDVIEALAPALSPYASIAWELGDSYAGSGGAGGDYNAGGMREGQQKFGGTAKSARRGRQDAPRQPRSGRHGVRTIGANRPHREDKQGDGWPADKSLALIPEGFAWALAYGRNPWTGRETDPWLVRNVCAWVRPNPPVGELGDKFRPATSWFTIATKSPRRWFDLEAVRLAGSPNTKSRLAKGVESRARTAKAAPVETDGAPPLDWWDAIEVVLEEALRQGMRSGRELSEALRDAGAVDWGDAWFGRTKGYKGAHHATWPAALLPRPIMSMCPERVCTVCGEPSRREFEERPEREGFTRNRSAPRARAASGSDPEHDSGARLHVADSICGHASWRRGCVLDPFAGTGTTLLVAQGHGRDSVGIDLDHRNVDLARERIGMFLDVEDLGATPPRTVTDVAVDL